MPEGTEITLTASGTKTANTYTITYNANKGKDAPSSQTETIGKATTLSTSTPTYQSGTTYLQFIAWNTKADGTGTNYKPGASYTGSGDVTLYAQWHTHNWNAIGNTLFGTSGWFTCKYQHTKAYNFYCSECGMSARYYNNKHGLGEESSGYVEPMACPASITIGNYFDDSSLYNSNIYTALTNVINCGGKYNNENGNMLTRTTTKPTENKNEHLPPTCELSYNESIDNPELEITNVKSYYKDGLASKPYSWTSGTSGFGTSNTLSGIDPYSSYNAWVKDAAGNVGKCYYQGY